MHITPLRTLVAAIAAGCLAERKHPFCVTDTRYQLYDGLSDRNRVSLTIELDVPLYQCCLLPLRAAMLHVNLVGI